MPSTNRKTCSITFDGVLGATLSSEHSCCMLLIPVSNVNAVSTATTQEHFSGLLTTLLATLNSRESFAEKITGITTDSDAANVSAELSTRGRGEKKRGGVPLIKSISREVSVSREVVGDLDRYDLGEPRNLKLQRSSSDLADHIPPKS
ncbi:hypothetical protein H0H92_003961 [Tricholoma furcatifolium]|nr:hypothetical protein H0H92_003961 [Tricholoma furcatifolium]